VAETDHSSYRTAEPVVETRRAEARVGAGGEALIVELGAEVAGVDVGDHMAMLPTRPRNGCIEYEQMLSSGYGATNCIFLKSDTRRLE
jgi:hypothetical protein